MVLPLMSDVIDTAAGPPYDAILVLSFGGPEQAEDIVPFLENVTAGRGIPRERLEQVGEHYHLFGGRSPINDQNRALISAVEARLADRGIDLPVYFGNRNWHPMLTDTVRQMADDGITSAIAFVTSATSSYSGCRQYRENIAAAIAAVGERAPTIDKIRQYYDHPGFIEPMVDATRTALDEVPAGSRLVFTAHSIPESMADGSDYVDQLSEASRLIANDLGHGEWDLVWQSRSGPPHIPWLEPDINDHLEALSDAGVPGVVMVPVGFISDHMEVMYDLDTEATATAKRLGLPIARAATASTDARFVEMVIDLVEERRSGTPAKSLGQFEVRPDVCRPGCCPAPTRPAGRPSPAPS